jgi:predicted RNA-binding Zn-ribbon protein involved in translation (DUF1610 family)
VSGPDIRFLAVWNPGHAQHRHSADIRIMKLFPCPKCHQNTIPLKEKYLVGIWMSVHCPQCGARVCAHPLLMTLLYFLYFWIAATCIFLAATSGSWQPLVVMAALWLLVDLANIAWMPLRAMRPRSG